MERYINKVIKITHPIRFRQDLLAQYLSYGELEASYYQE